VKITGLQIHILKTPLEQPFAFSQGWVRQRSATLVEVQTSDGITGWGEAFAQGLEPPEIAATVIDRALRPLVADASDTQPTDSPR
jgi:D-galactarolactone cycloisomerase